MKAIIFLLIFILNTSHIYSQSGWFIQHSNLNKELHKVFFVNSQTGWIIADSSKILKTTDGGNYWFQQYLPNYYTPLAAVFFLDENTGWTGGGYYYFAHFGQIFKTTNGGINWYLQTTNNTMAQDFYFLNNSTGFMSTDKSGDFGTGGSVSKTTNGGLTWIGSTSVYSYAFRVVKFKDNNTGWTVGNYRDDTGHDSILVLKTIDGGNTWVNKFRESNSPAFYNRFQDLAVKENRIWVLGKDTAILFSSDYGETWSRQLSPHPGRMNSIFFADLNTGWAAGYTNFDTTNIIKTTNGGVSWFKLRNQYSNPIYSIFFVNENTGWTVGSNYPTGEGIILKTFTGGLTFVQQSSSIVLSEFRLEQNYPNPFNPKTIIKYEFRTSNYVSLKVYDVRGNEIASLVEDKKNAGAYEVEFDGSNLSSGIYYYRLYLNGKNIETKKMILLK